MAEHNSAPLHTILVVLALVLFGLAAFTPPWAPSEPWNSYRLRMTSAGLMFWVASTFF